MKQASSLLRSADVAVMDVIVSVSCVWRGEQCESVEKRDDLTVPMTRAERDRDGDCGVMDSIVS